MFHDFTNMLGVWQDRLRRNPRNLRGLQPGWHYRQRFWPDRRGPGKRIRSGRVLRRQSFVDHAPRRATSERHGSQQHYRQQRSNELFCFHGLTRCLLPLLDLPNRTIADCLLNPGWLKEK